MIQRFVRLTPSVFRPGKFRFLSGMAQAPVAQFSGAPPHRPHIGVAFDLEDRPGSLLEALQVLATHGVNLSSISNRASPLPPHTQMFYLHFEGSFEDKRVKEALGQLKSLAKTKMYKISAPVVPWFPRKIADLDQFGQITLDAGAELESDHPGFNDEEYRRRRQHIADIASTYRQGQAIPHVDYSEKEVDTWETVWNKLTSLYPTLACREFNNALGELQAAGLYGPRRVPQLQEVSDYMKARTGFTLRPVQGLLSGRDFLNALAFRVFFSTQYIRHHSVPMYTPEPDICHELLGHAPMFLDPDFADFTQYIGLASLGASDEEIERLATCYWFSVEFGLMFEDGAVKAYGAGILSSFGELQHATSPTNSTIEIRPWEPAAAYPITTMQPIYYAASSMKDAKTKMKAYCDSIKKPFNSIFDAQSQSVYTDVDVFTKPVGMKFSPVTAAEENWKDIL